MLTFTYLQEEIEKKGKANKTIAKEKHHTTGIRSRKCNRRGGLETYTVQDFPWYNKRNLAEVVFMRKRWHG